MRCRFALLALLACTPAFADALDRIAGNVRYADRFVLPADATLTVELLDLPAPGARVERLARLALPTHGRQVPLAFELPFHTADVKPGHRYVLRATLINGGGELLFQGTQAAFAGAQPELILQPARDAAPPAPLENTYWKLIEIRGQPARVQPGEREAYLLLLDGRASGSSGCNKLMGRYAQSERTALTVGPLASTRLACAQEMMAQENALLDAYAHTRAYRIDGESLVLLEGDTILARFVARNFK